MHSGTTHIHTYTHMHTYTDTYTHMHTYTDTYMHTGVDVCPSCHGCSFDPYFCESLVCSEPTHS